MVKHSVFLFLILARTIGLGQVNWPEDEQMEKLTREKVALYSDALKNEQVKEALAPLQWLLQNVPYFSKGIYIDGAKVYQQLAHEASEAHKEALSRQVMQIYDQRARYFPEGGELLNRKAWAAYELHRKDPQKANWLFDLIKNAVDSLQVQVYKNLLVAHLDILRLKSKISSISQDTLLQTYFTNKQLLLEKSVNDEDVQQELKMLDKLFFNLAELDCVVIDNRFKPDSSDFEQVKLYLGLALAYQCYESDYFIPAAEQLLEIEADFGLAKLLAILYTKYKNKDRLIHYWEMALDLATETKKKAAIYLSIAQVYQNFNQLEKARTQVVKALQTGEANEKEAYNLLGDLYGQSFSHCKQGKSKVQDYSVYIAAWEMYAKAGNQEKMQQMQRTFPSREELHAEDLKPGDLYRVNCWIGREVTLRTRD